MNFYHQHFLPHPFELIVLILFISIIRRCKMGEMRGAYGALVGKPEGRRPLERPKRRWEDNIKMDLREVEWRGIGWICLAKDRDRWRALVNKVMNLRVP